MSEFGFVRLPSSIPSDLLRCLQGPNLGKGGVDIIPSSERTAPMPPSHLQFDENPESLSSAAVPLAEEGLTASRTLLPRETGDDIGAMSPVPLSAEVVTIITQLRNLKVGLSFLV